MRLKLVQILICISLLMAIGTFPKQFSLSKPMDSKKTKQRCLFCHTKYGSKELTKAGKYYKDKGTLDGFDEASEALLHLKGKVYFVALQPK